MCIMWKSIFLYVFVLMLVVFVLEWLEFYYLVCCFGLEIFVGILVVGFCVLGIWVGMCLMFVFWLDRFECNDVVIKFLGIFECEYDVLV